ncbi:hypothetical protein QJS10_CPB19g00702 [Acorus calamus]|uniref:Uncharacterized protein n=1 Tax=Acorus calamus TaxID=4465 RepID=A0AAV9CH03_ACOCL|nr:hypothetical protein QJS10_CPB19g00702 [Acorus calamus]
MSTVVFASRIRCACSSPSSSSLILVNTQIRNPTSLLRLSLPASFSSFLSSRGPQNPPLRLSRARRLARMAHTVAHATLGLTKPNVIEAPQEELGVHGETLLSILVMTIEPLLCNLWIYTRFMSYHDNLAIDFGLRDSSDFPGHEN